MSDCTKESVKTLSKLCRIELTDEELDTISEDLKKVLDYVELLQEVDVTDLPPFSHLEEQGIEHLREDEVKNQLPRDTFLKNAPEQVGGMIRVPTVIKQ